MRHVGHLPFEGEIIWLTREQGGRRSGPPATPPDQDYAGLAFVPPHTVETGLAPFIIRIDDREAWRSHAWAAWLLAEGSADQSVVPGTVIVVTEGPQPVAFFRVDAVHPDPLPAALRSLDLNALVGCPVEEARSRVKAAGGWFRTYDDEHPWLTLDYVPVRVTARVEAGHVAEIHGFG